MCLICELIGVSEPHLFIFEIFDLFIFEIFDLFGKLESKRAREGGGEREKVYKALFVKAQTGLYEGPNWPKSHFDMFSSIT